MSRSAPRNRPVAVPPRRALTPARLACALCLTVLVPASAAAQQPPPQTSPTNLQVLPKDWTRQQVVDVMRTFTVALGVRCSACHVEDDDASDEKELKQIARTMMRMSSAINGTYLAALPDREEAALKVTCITCHRGVSHPEPIEAILRQTVEEAGVEAALERYGELRERYYGAFAYDFTDRPLISLAEGLSAANPDAARRFLELSLELNPLSAGTMFGLARLYDGANDKDKAIEFYRKGLEIMPNNQQAQRRLRELTGGA